MASFRTLMIIGISAALLCTACQQEGAAPAGSQGQSQNSAGNFFEQLGNAVKEGVKSGIDNGIETSDSVGVLGYTMMPSKLTRRSEPAYCLENPATHKLITVAPMFGRPYLRPDNTTGFMQTTQQRSEHTQRIEVNLNGALPGQTCADLIANHRLTPGIAPNYYY